MRRFFIIAILSGLMYGLNFFEVQAIGTVGVNPKSLASFGFVLLAAFTIGELIKVVKMPTITGFLIAGVIFGHYGPFGPEGLLGFERHGERVAVFLSKDIVAELSHITNLAVGLIALTAGAELQVQKLKKDIRSVLIIITMQVLVIMPLVAGAFVGSSSLVPWASLGLNPAVAANPWFLAGLGIMVGALSVGNSPAVSVAIVDESGSKGDFTDVNLGVTIVKDLVVVLLFAVSASVAKSWLDPQGHFDFLHVSEHLAKEIGLSVAVGLVIGVVIWLYLKYVKQELMIFLVGIIFLGMYTATVLHLEKILVFIAAGFVVENAWVLSQKQIKNLVLRLTLSALLAALLWALSVHLSALVLWGLTLLAFSDLFIIYTLTLVGVLTPPPPKEEHDHHHDPDAHIGHEMITKAVKPVSLPVYVVFFAIQGANLNLKAIQAVIVISIIVVAIRALLMLISTRIGTKLAGLPAVFQKSLGLGFLSQAGVTLGLVGLAASNQLDPISGLTAAGFVGDFGLGKSVFVPIMMGVVAINLLVGPVLLKVSLSASGETADQRDKASSPDADAQGIAADDAEDVEEAEGAPQDPLMRVVIDLNSDALNDTLGKTRDRLQDAIGDFKNQLIDVNRGDFQDLMRRLQGITHEHFRELQVDLERTRDDDVQRRNIQNARVAIANALLRHLGTERVVERDAQSDLKAFEVLISDVEATLTVLRRDPLAVPISDADFAPAPDDSSMTTALKRLALMRLRYTPASARVRYVDLPRLCRFYVTGPIPHELVMIANMAGHQRFYAWRRIRFIARRIDELLVTLLKELGDDRLSTLLIDLPDSHLAHAERESKQKTDTLARTATIAQSIEEEFQQAIDDFNAYAQDVTSRLQHTIARVFEQFVDACRVTGTFQLPERQTNYSRVYDKNRAGREQIPRDLKNWRKASLGFSGRLMTYLDLVSLHHNSHRQITDAEFIIIKALLDDLMPWPEKVAGELQEAINAFNKHLTPDTDHQAIRRLVRRVREDLADLINRQAIAKLETQRDLGRFLDLLDDFFRGLDRACLSVHRGYEVITSQDARFQEGVSPGEVALDHLPLRDLARRHLISEIAIQLNPINALIKSAVDQTITQLSNVLRILTYQLDAIINDLGPEEAASSDAPHPIDLARESAESGLRRAINILEERGQTIQKVYEQVIEMINQKTFDQLRTLQSIALEADLKTIREFIAKHEAKGDIDSSGGLRPRVTNLWLRANTFYQSHIKPATEQLTELLSQRLGLEPPNDAPLVTITDQASFDAVHNEKIPLAYRRPFVPTPVDIDEFFIGYSQELSRTREAYQRFLTGKPSSVIIHGESGSGKTSFVERILHKLNPELPVIRMFVTHTICSEQQLAMSFGEFFRARTTKLDHLRTWLRNSKRQRVVIIEGLHNFFLRTPNGFDALQKFLLLVSETSHVFFWVITINTDTLRYLQQMTPVDDYFTHHIELGRFNTSDIRRLIETRHKVSGYKLEFLLKDTPQEEAPEEDDDDEIDDEIDGDDFTTASSRRAEEEKRRKAAEATAEARERRKKMLRRVLPDLPLRRGSSQEHLAESFFSALTNASQGNIRLALFYWLRSLHDYQSETDTIEVSPLKPLDTRFLYDLEPEQLIALATLIIHSGLTIEEFATVSRLSAPQSRALITHLHQNNLLTIDRGKVDTFYVNAVLFGPIVDHLRAHHIL